MKTRRPLLTVSILAALVALVCVLVQLSGSGKARAPQQGDGGVGEANPALPTKSDRPAAEGGGEAPAPEAVPELTRQMQPLLGAESDWSTRQRVNWLQASGDKMTGADRDSLLAFIAAGLVPEGLTEAEWFWLIDQAFSSLRRHDRDPGALTAGIKAIFDSPLVLPTVRDYALQHLGHLAHEGGDAGLIHAALQSALAERGSTLAGTSLLALHRDPPPPAAPAGGLAATPVDLGAAALAVLSDQASSDSSRISALQVAALHNPSAALEYARTALAGEAPSHLQITALATVAALEGSEARAFLQSVLADAKPPLRQRILLTLRQID